MCFFFESIARKSAFRWERTFLATQTGILYDPAFRHSIRVINRYFSIPNAGFVTPSYEDRFPELA